MFCKECTHTHTFPEKIDEHNSKQNIASQRISQMQLEHCYADLELNAPSTYVLVHYRATLRLSSLVLQSQSRIYCWGDAH